MPDTSTIRKPLPLQPTSSIHIDASERPMSHSRLTLPNEPAPRSGFNTQQFFAELSSTDVEVTALQYIRGELNRTIPNGRQMTWARLDETTWDDNLEEEYERDSEEEYEDSP